MTVKKNTFLADYYNEQLTDICLFMEYIPGSYKNKDIHQLRVRIKRLKSVFLLLEYIYTSDFSAKENYGLFRPVFKTAGRLREVQLNSDLLKKFPGTDKLQKAYDGYASAILPGMTEDLDMAIAGFDHSRLDRISSRVGDLFGKHEESVIVDMITGFITSVIQRIEALIEDKGQAEYMHDIRIMLKNIKPLLMLVYPVSFSVFSKAHYTQLNNTESSIGKWHDLEVLVASLSSFIDVDGNRNSGIYQEYAVFEKKLVKEKKEALDKAQKSITEKLLFFNKGPSTL